jgi:hypothetical protein
MCDDATQSNTERRRRGTAGIDHVCSLDISSSRTRNTMVSLVLLYCSLHPSFNLPCRLPKRRPTPTDICRYDRHIMYPELPSPLRQTAQKYSLTPLEDHEKMSPHKLRTSAFTHTTAMMTAMILMPQFSIPRRYSIFASLCLHEATRSL